ncbi:MAG: CinA family nicotinamide mononucleotide deamidase-related protein [Bacteroidales bacterium]|nr:CinA family nicotinamide mononucleotide deamidase-related protein [Bacteroidales bacterium]
MNVEIVTIGDELLIGQVIDTNSAWMAQQLNEAGFRVVWKTSIGDDEQDIINAFSAALKRADVVLVTGGIGPTKDDITKKTLCKFFHTELVESPETLTNIKEILRKSDKTLNELTASQALVPKDCTVIQNKAGTAPITWFDRNGKVLVSMPGVPFEMKWVMSNEIIPRLAKHFQRDVFILHRTLYVANFTESKLAMRLEDFETTLPDYIKLAYLPAAGLIRLRLTGQHKDGQMLTEHIDSLFYELHQILGDNIVTDSDEAIEIVLGNLLRKKGYTLGTAESCTGGRIAHAITSVPGASDYYTGGVVVYSNAMKEALLGVSPSTLQQYGAVSEEVVLEMLKGTQKRIGCHCAIAVSGIAGPSGGTPEKPVGTVWIGVASGDKYRIRMFHFGTNREQNILKSTTIALLFMKGLLDETEN